MWILEDELGGVVRFSMRVGNMTVAELQAFMTGGRTLSLLTPGQLSARLLETEQRWLREIKDDLADAEQRGVLFCSSATAFEIAADVMRCEQPTVCSAACRLIGEFPRAADRFALVTAILGSVRRPAPLPTI